LRLGTQQLLNLGLGGISFVGDDVGGFNFSPPPDLLTRWLEIGAFHPLFRDHTSFGTLPQEVWVHGPAQEAIRRRYIETRYRLLPYIYTLAEEASRDGLPLMRPIFLEFPDDFDASDTEFLLGPDLLVAPPMFGETLDDYAVSYPPGDWYDFWTGHKMPHSATAPSIVEVSMVIANGRDESSFPQPLKTHPRLDTLPVYVRGGSIIPMQPVVQSTDQIPEGPLELRVYPGQQCSGSIYLDDGHTFRYQQGDFLRQEFTCQSDSNSVRVDFSSRQGKYVPWWKTIEVVIYDWPSVRAVAKFSNSPSPLKTAYDAASRTLRIFVPDINEEAALTIGGGPSR
jgi:alpha-glucosidase